MKKQTALILAAAMLLCLSACGDKTSPETVPTETVPMETAPTETTAAPGEMPETAAAEDGSLYRGFYSMPEGFLEIREDGTFAMLDHSGLCLFCGTCLFHDGLTLVYEDGSTAFFVLDGDNNLYGGENRGTFLRIGAEEPVDAPNGFLPEEYAGRWYLSGDPASESLTIHPEGLWELRNRVNDDGSGGYILCQGFASPTGFDTLALFENTGAEAGFVTPGDGALTLVLTMDYAFLLESHGSGDLVFLGEHVSVSDEVQAAPPVLMNGGRFTGMEPMEASNDFRGGYLYRDRTEDTLTIVTNCCMASNQAEGESMEDYILRVIAETGGREPRNLTFRAHDAHSQRLSYPVLLLAWETGSNEDTRGCSGFFFMTDTHTYLFSFDAPIDHQREMQEVWDFVFETLTLG